MMAFSLAQIRTMLILLPLLLMTGKALAQHTFSAVILDSATASPVIGATAVLKGTTQGGVTDDNGRVKIIGIPPGPAEIMVRMTGYQNRTYAFSLPLADTIPVRILLPHQAEELGEIIVEGTRSNRSIANIPTRVEVLTEEIDEASTMDPSKVAHLLTHSTGIQVQQTSATSNTANVRIQGLDGRYTQILKDGFPLYGGFSGSLSIMQIPPLDLRQVEYIKGSASTLYGGGAIAGLINLISKEPSGNETLVHLNHSHVGAFDVNTFFSRRIKKMGLTLLAQRNTHQPFDADRDGYSDLPKLTKYNFNPKLFYYFSDRTRMSLGATFTSETRKGGDMDLVNDAPADTGRFYRETNDINRVTTQLKLEHAFDETVTLMLRNSFNIFRRNLFITPAPLIQEYRFGGRQVSSFSEAALSVRHKQNVLIAGLNFYTDEFREQQLQSPVLRNEDYSTLGAFANYTFDVGNSVSIESGLRADYVFGEKLFVLPRLSALFKWTSKFTTRIGGGMGYRNPTIFNQEAELFGYQNILPINKDLVKAEQSYGGSADIGYRTRFGEHFSLNINQMFFYTLLDKPVVLGNSIGMPGYFSFRNAIGHTRSYGAETFFKFGFYDFMFFAGYTYTNAMNFFSGGETVVTLTPAHSLKGDLLYSLPGKWRIGVDYEYKSSQTVSTGAATPSYWTFGALVEHTWKYFTFFGNVENFTNVRQTNYGSLRSGPYDTPQFTEVWAPLDGIVFNYGLKVRL